VLPKLKRKKKPILPRIDVMNLLVAKDLQQYEQKKSLETPVAGPSMSPAPAPVSGALEGNVTPPSVVSTSPTPKVQIEEATSQPPIPTPAPAVHETLEAPSADDPPENEMASTHLPSVVPEQGNEESENDMSVDPAPEAETSMQERQSSPPPELPSPKDEMEVDSVVFTEPSSMQNHISKPIATEDIIELDSSPLVENKPLVPESLDDVYVLTRLSWSLSLIKLHRMISSSADSREEGEISDDGSDVANFEQVRC
jgi:hypothetical protein